MVSKYLTTMSHIMEPVIGCCPTMGLIPACLKTSRSSRKNSSTKLALSELNSIVSTSCSFCSLSTCVCVCMCVCMCVRVCTRKTNTHAPIHMHAHMHIHIHAHIRMYRSRQRKTVVLTKAPFQLAKLCVFELFRHLRLWLLLHLKLHVAQHPEEGWLAAAAAARASAARLAPNHLLGHGENGAQTVRCAASACACVCQ